MLISSLLEEYFSTKLSNHLYISEESYPKTHKWNKQKSYVFVDPIDGTENFVSGLKEWGVGVSIFTEGKY